MKLTIATMRKRHTARAALVKYLKTRICQLEIQNYELREKNGKLEQEILQLKCQK